MATPPSAPCLLCYICLSAVLACHDGLMSVCVLCPASALCNVCCVPAAEPAGQGGDRPRALCGDGAFRELRHRGMSVGAAADARIHREGQGERLPQLQSCSSVLAAACLRLPDDSPYLWRTFCCHSGAFTTCLAWTLPWSPTRDTKRPSEPGECPEASCNAYMGLQHDVVRDSLFHCSFSSFLAATMATLTPSWSKPAPAWPP